MGYSFEGERIEMFGVWGLEPSKNNLLSILSLGAMHLPL